MYSKCGSILNEVRQLIEIRGVVLSPAVIPIGLTVTWSKLNKVSVFAGTLTGFVTGMLAWMIGCWKIYGKLLILKFVFIGHV